MPQKPPTGHKAKGSVVPPLNLNVQPGAVNQTQERKQTYSSGRGPQGTAPNVITSNLDTQQNLITESGEMKKPPVSIKQSDILYMPHKRSRRHADDDYSLHFYDSKIANSGLSPYPRQNPREILVDCSEQSRSHASARSMNEPLFNDQNLLFLSKTEATLRRRIDVRENSNAKELVGTKHLQNELKNNAKAVNTSPDGNFIVILSAKLSVYVQDLRPISSKIAFENSPIYEVEGLAESLQEALKTREEYILNSLGITGLRASQKEKQKKEKQYRIYMDNDMTNIIVISIDDQIVLTWSRSFDKGSRSKSADKAASGADEEKKIPGTTLNSARGDSPSKLGFFRSNSMTKIGNKDEKERSRSRLRSLFNIDLLKGQKGKEERAMSSQRGSGRVEAEEQIRTSSAARQRPPPAKQMKLDTLQGTWTNTTLHMSNETAKNIKPLSSVLSVSFPNAGQNKHFSAGLNQMEGMNGRLEGLSNPREEGVLMQINMYDRAAYLRSFERSVKHGGADDQILDEGIDQDSNTEKILVISTQTCYQDLVNRADVWYQSQYYLVDKQTLVTDLDYMGVLEKPDQEKILIARPDNQGNLMAIVANSVHKYFCQLIFVNLKTKFVNAMKLSNFVTTVDYPPFDSKGKTSLQIDDLAWTRNDAFVILMFNTGALAILPRLGSQLLRIFNPTLMNVDRNDASLYEQYNQPRGFNELIMNRDIAAKVKKLKAKQGVVSSRYQIQMHPSQEAFVVYDGYVAFVMRLELEPELSELFDRKNMSYYFIRFCFSMNVLAKDQDILEKVPQLLTSKLPLFEFEKNQDKFKRDNLNYNEAHRIQTFSQINAFQQEEKRMETNQSFDADFSEEPEVVLLNFKHLLYSFRWNPNLGLNYLEWLVTVVNDCFFYFLKNNEPLYAYHCLIIAEYYIKKVLHKSQTASVLIDAETSEAIESVYLMEKDDSEQDSDESLDGDNSQRDGQQGQSKFEQMALRMMDPIYEIYMKGTGLDEEDADNEKKEEGTGVNIQRKMQIKNEFLKGLPNQVLSGNGNLHFQFQKNYLLLIYHSLIQFRNYQASNINIISLLLASYIMGRQLNASFRKQLYKIQAIITKNNSLLSKTDEMDLFFGKCGVNTIEEAPGAISTYQDWVQKYVIFGSAYSSKFFRDNNLFLLTDTLYLKLAKNEPMKAVEVINEKLTDFGTLLLVVECLETGDLNMCIDLIKVSSEEYLKTINEPHIRSPTQELSISLLLFANQLYYLTKSSRMRKTTSLLGMLGSIAELSIKLDKKSPINCISEATKIFDAGFRHNPGPYKGDRAKKALMQELNLRNQNQFNKFTAMLFAYLGDLQRASQLLKPSVNQPACIDLLLFNMLLLSSAFKTQIKLYDALKDSLKDFNIKTVQSLSVLQQTTERLNCVHTIKYAMAEMNCTMHRIKDCMRGSAEQRTALWASFAMLPFGVALPIKEQIAFDAIQNMKAIMTHNFNMETKVVHGNGRIYKADDISRQSIIQKYPLAETFFKTSQMNYTWLEKTLMLPNIVLERFLQQIEVALICFWDQNNSTVLVESVKQISTKNGDSATADKQYIEPDQGFDMQTLLYKDFRKFTKIYMFLKIKTDIAYMDAEIKKLELYEISAKQDATEEELAEMNRKVGSQKIEVLVHIMSSLFRLFFFPKYTQIQVGMRRALSILTQLLFHTELVTADVRQNVLAPMITQISYPRLSRSNKLIANGILDRAKQKVLQEPEGGFQTIVGQLESTIFDRAQRPQTAKSIEAQMKDPDELEFMRTHEEVVAWLNQQVLPEIDFKGLNRRGVKQCIQQKKDLFEHAACLHERFGLTMDSSIFYRGSCFEKKNENIFGLSEELIKDFMAAKRHEENERELKKKDQKPSQVRNDNVQQKVTVEEKKEPGAQESKEEDEEENVMDKSQVDALAVSRIEHEASEVVNMPQIRMNELVMNVRQNWGFRANTPREDLSDNLYRLGYMILDEKNEQQQKLVEESERSQQSQAESSSMQDQPASVGQAGPPLNPLSQASTMFTGPAFQSNSQSTSNMTLQDGISADDSQRQADQRTDLKLDLGKLAKRNDPKHPRISKVTLRKNSVRRRIAAPEAEPRNSRKNQSAKKMRMGLPPKPSASTKEPNKEQPAPLAETEQSKADEEQTAKLEDESNSQTNKRVPIVVKRANEFSLIYVSKPKKNKERRRESEGDKEKVKVKLPMKVLAQKLVESEETKEVGETPEKDLGSLKITQVNKKKVQPFQLLKVKKASPSMRKDNQASAEQMKEEDQEEAKATDGQAQEKQEKQRIKTKKKTPLILFKNLSEEKKVDVDKKQRMILNLVEKLDAVKQEASKIKFDQ